MRRTFYPHTMEPGIFSMSMYRSVPLAIKLVYASVHGLICRLFLYENIPQLKYHNPLLQVVVKCHKDENSKILFYSGI